LRQWAGTPWPLPTVSSRFCPGARTPQQRIAWVSGRIWKRFGSHGAAVPCPYQKTIQSLSVIPPIHRFPRFTGLRRASPCPSLWNRYRYTVSPIPLPCRACALCPGKRCTRTVPTAAYWAAEGLQSAPWAPRGPQIHPEGICSLQAMLLCCCHSAAVLALMV